MSDHAETRHTEPLVYKGGTIRDDSADGRATPKDDSGDALAEALADALKLATKEGRLDIVERILVQVERRRG